MRAIPKVLDESLKDVFSDDINMEKLLELIEWAKEARTEMEILKLLITKREQLQAEYIKLLGDEINDMSGIASIHGWKSQNVERGKELRAKLDLL